MQQPPAFTGRDSYQRLQQLQDLCKQEDGRGFDALLLVGGADGLYSHGSQAALKYLFLGKSGQELLGEQVIPQQYEALEDIIVVVTRTSVSIFYVLDSDSATFLLPFLSNWRNVTEFVATDDMTQDLRELTKIRAFRSMVEPHRTIGIPLHEPAKGAKDAPTAEAWPIVQSFGLDDVHPANAAKGFFSMHHNVVNCVMALTARLTDIDDFSARRLAADAEPALAHHFGGFLAKLDHAETPAARAAFTEADIADDLSSFYDFGTIRHDARGLHKSAHRGASVHFGARASANAATPSSKTVTADQAGVSGQFPATHFTVLAEEPLTGLRVGRTYFVGTGKCAARIVDPDALVSQGDSKLDRYDAVPSNAPDTLRLIALYTKLLTIHTTATLPAVVASAKSSGSSPKDWEAAALAAAVKSFGLQIADAFSDAALLVQQLAVRVEVVDACGEVVTAIEPHTKWCHAYVTTTIGAVTSTVVEGANLGALIVGDSILVDLVTPAPAFLPLTTSSFPYFRTWIQAGMEADYAAHVDAVLASDYMLDHVIKVGRLVGDSVSHAPVLVQADHVHVVRGTLQPYAQGFVLKSPHSQPLVVSFPTHVRALRVLSTPHEELLLVVVDFVATSNPVTEWLPGAAASAASIALPLLAGSRMQESLLGVLDVWKASAAGHDIPFLKPTTDDLEPIIPHGFQRGCNALLDKADDAVAAAQDRFFPQWFISKAPSQVSAWIKPKSVAALVVPVTVFLGVPGSEVHALAASLAELTAGANEWHHVVVDTRELSAASSDLAAYIPRKLADTMTAIKASDGDWTRRPRILLTVVGYVDPITVCAAIKRTTDDKAVKLSTVTTVISSVATTTPGTDNPFPKLWDQLAAGFVTTVVLTHTQDVDKVRLHRLRTRVDAANPFADVLCLRSNGLDGDLTAFLALDVFETPERQRYRDAHFPDWPRTPSAYVAPLPSSVTAVRFHMEVKVDRARFAACIQRGLSPNTTLKTISPVSPAQPPPQLSGLRLAQALALEKVTQGTLTTKEDNVPDDVAAIVAQVGQVWTVEASLAFADDRHHGYTYLSTGSKAFLRPQPSLSSPPTSCTFVFTGDNLNAEKLRVLLLQCCPARHSAVAAIEAVTLDEKRRIQALHVTDPLPDGYMFDGTSYYDYFGGQYEFHPNIQRFIDDHVASKKDVATRQNNELEQDRLRYEECTKQF